jgi:hypothetical protein
MMGKSIQDLQVFTKNISSKVRKCYNSVYIIDFLLFENKPSVWFSGLMRKLLCRLAFILKFATVKLCWELWGYIMCISGLKQCFLTLLCGDLLLNRRSPPFCGYVLLITNWVSFLVWESISVFCSLHSNSTLHTPWPSKLFICWKSVDWHRLQEVF